MASVFLGDAGLQRVWIWCPVVGGVRLTMADDTVRPVVKEIARDSPRPCDAPRFAPRR